jgi:exodeoxyribonuclease VII large subunit
MEAANRRILTDGPSLRSLPASRYHKPVEQFALEFDLTPQRRIFTVNELNAAIRAVLDSEFTDIWVSGEISGLKLATSGHYYFTLKERDAQVKCVSFRSAHRYWKFKPQDGMAVLARGRIDVYEARGEYQLQVETIEPQGLGALQVAFEQLKKKLAAEGLFSPQRKRPLPRFPRRIGIVTSPRGAAIADMVQILTRRFPGLHIRLFPALVQGEGSVEEICRAIDYFSRTRWPDLVIVGRGGGSLEDLWSFNSEAVARSIAACSVPVVSAVGHETDITIADFVSDLRAPTPSAAAEMAVCTREELLERIAATRTKGAQAMRYRLAMLERRLRQQGIDRALNLLHRRIGRGLQRADEHEYRLRERIRAAIESRERARRALETRLKRFDMRPRLAADRRRLETAHAVLLETVRPRLADCRKSLDSAHAGLMQTIRLRLANRRNLLEQLTAKLTQLSPLRILDRGYAIVSTGSAILKDSALAPLHTRIHVRLAKGSIDAEVVESRPSSE